VVHGKVHQNCPENSAPKTQIWAVRRMEAVDQHRVFKPSGSEIDDGYQDGHADATDEVARPLPDIEALPAAVPLLCLELAAAGLKMAKKASEPF
jgi:hypothetical protein